MAQDPKEAGKQAGKERKPKSMNPYTGKQRANYERDQWNEGFEEG